MDESSVICPVRVVAGSDDRITPASVVRIAGKYRSVSTYREFEGHGHWVIWEPDWREIAEYVADWLNTDIY